MSVTDTASSRILAKNRQRTFHSKVRTGCDTCKRRKIRCDETRPYCLRCERSNFECAGYNPPKAKIFEPRPPKTTSGQTFTPIQPRQNVKTNLELADTVVPRNTNLSSQLDLEKTITRPCGNIRNESESGPSAGASAYDYITVRPPRVMRSPSLTSNQNFPCLSDPTGMHDHPKVYLSDAEGRGYNTNLLEDDLQDDSCLNGSSTLWDIAVRSSRTANLRRDASYWGTLVRQMPKNCGGDPTAIRAYQFFHENTKGLLRTFCTASEQMYATLSPQLAFSEAAVKLQLITIGLSHELASTQPKNRQHLQLKLMEYHSLALQSLTKPRTIEPAVLLLCSLLFTTLEIVRGQARETLTHIKSSIRIMMQQKNSASAAKARTFSSQNLEHQVERLNARFAATASLYTSWSVIHEVPTLKWVKPAIPNCFNGVQQALEKFYDLLQWTNFGPYSNLECHSSICALWMQWRQRLHNLIPMLRPGPRRSYLQAKLVDTYWEMYQRLAEGQGQDEMFWDDFVEEHRRWLDTCAEICLSEETYQPAVDGREDFDVVPGVQGPLWVIATACRDPFLRRRALDFLRVHQMRCGRTDGNPAAVVAEFVISTEEASLGQVWKASDVSIENRIRIVYADYSGVDTVKIIYSHSPFTDSDLTFQPLPLPSDGQMMVGNLEALDSIVTTKHKLWKGAVRDPSKTGYYQGLRRYIKFDLNPLICNEHAHLYR